MMELQEALAHFSPEALELVADEIQSSAEWGHKVRSDTLPQMSDEEELRLEVEVEQAMVEVAVRVRSIAKQVRTGKK